MYTAPRARSINPRPINEFLICSSPSAFTFASVFAPFAAILSPPLPVITTEINTPIIVAIFTRPLTPAVGSLVSIHNCLKSLPAKQKFPVVLPVPVPGAVGTKVTLVHPGKLAPPCVQYQGKQPEVSLPGRANDKFVDLQRFTSDVVHDENFERAESIQLLNVVVHFVLSITNGLVLHFVFASLHAATSDVWALKQAGGYCCAETLGIETSKSEKNRNKTEVSFGKFLNDRKFNVGQQQISLY